MNYKKQLTIPLLLLSLSTFSSATNYFDGDDGTVGNWKVYDNKPAGAVVSNVIDEIKNSKVIEFKGDSRRNSYMLGARDWNNRTEKYLKWSMKFSEKFKITVYLKTKKGVRTLFYVYKNKDEGLYQKRYIKFGLGSKSMNGIWQNYTRDIEADLKKYEPDNELIKIKGMKVQGSGRMDDVRLEKKGDNSCITRKELEIKIRNSEDVTKVNTSCIKDMAGLFSQNSTFNQDISNWDVSNVTNMRNMFYGALSFNQPIGNWDVSNVENMHRMFQWTDKFNQSIENWDISKVKDMSNMFDNADAFNKPLAQWNVSHITNMESLFSQTAEFNQPIGNWNLSNVTNMKDMFRGAVSFNQPVEDWNVSNVTNMKNIFYYAKSFNHSVKKWDVSNVTDMYRMFGNAKNFTNHDLSGWNIQKVEVHDELFRDAGKNNIEPKWIK